jgi:hypothetical protein
LGVLYANGLGVPQDYVKAYMWYSLAGAAFTVVRDSKSVEVTHEEIAKLADKMTAEQIDTARDLAAKWEPSN